MCLGLFCLLMFGFVSAEMLINEVGVEYDYEIVKEFDKAKLNESLNDSEIYVGIIIELEDLSKSEFFVNNYLSNKKVKNIVNRNISNLIGVDVTEEVFFSLLNNSEISKITYDSPMYLSSGHFSKDRNYIYFILLLIISILFLLIKLKK